MADDLRTMIRRLRPGDGFTVKRVADLAVKMTDALALLDEIHSRGAHVVDAQGRRSDKDMVAMLRESMPYMRKGATRKQARASGGKGGRPKAVREMPDEKAEPVWRNVKRYKTNIEAVAAMPGWSLAAAYKAFGPSGRDKPGRPKRKS
jgi:DNA invertase Pin-like site-specific DNA recombinase